MCEHPYHMRFTKAFPLNYRDMPEEHQKFFNKGHIMSETDYRANKEGIQQDYYMDIPCGYCAECKLQKAKNIATRCIMEAQMHEENCFVTLTYRPKDLPTYSPHDKHIYIKTGNLIKRDVQNFFKRLKKKYPEKNIRRIYSGEYGPRRKRPHWHCLIFGYMPSDLVFWKYDKKTKSALYKSKELQKIWGLGFLTVGFVTIESAGYCARYTMKKAGIKPQKKNKRPNPMYNPLDPNCKYNKFLYDKPVKEPECVHSSRRPGLGRTYWAKYEQKIKKDGGIWVFNSKLKKVVLNPIPDNYKIIWKETYKRTQKFDYWENLTVTKKRIYKEVEEYYNFQYKMIQDYEQQKIEMIKQTGQTWEDIREKQIHNLHERIRQLKREEEFCIDNE